MLHTRKSLSLYNENGILLFTILSLCLPVFLQAQPRQEDLTGSYYLTGVMETASGIRLNKNGTFDFFYSYGALDRFGSGTWEQKGNNSIVLNSRPYPGSDFKLITSSESNSSIATIRLDEKNTSLLKYTYCIVKENGFVRQYSFNEKGIITFPAQPIDTLFLIFEFCPEKISSFPIINHTMNNFTFQSEPWLLEVFFRDFTLLRTSDGLEGGHPLL
ncbi:MAG: hypothetical protein ICV65_20400 [Flavisolibacter sp.]|nr:hypothetical protein [Flavisolibacter sp.]